MSLGDEFIHLHELAYEKDDELQIEAIKGGNISLNVHAIESILPLGKEHSLINMRSREAWEIWEAPSEIFVKLYKMNK